MLEKQPVGVQEEKPKADITLSNEINAATRNQHTALNRLITSRIPLALPPNAADSSLYATGLLHFSHIFLTFESLWADLLRDHASPPSRSTSPRRAPTTQPLDHDIPSPPTSPLLSYLLVNPYDSPSFFTSTLGAPTPPSPQLASFLQTLRPKGLLRSSRIKRDLEHLLSLHPTDLEVLLATYPGDKVAAFCTHIRRSVKEKPWTLVAYAWCFYMAVFSGGRWIRAQLRKAPAGFWEEGQTPLEDAGLSLWHFAGQHDGEDIKAAFKARLLGAEALFSPDERVDIIEEAKRVFEMCAGLVEELDAKIGTRLDGEGQVPRVEAHGEGQEVRASEGEDEKAVLLGEKAAEIPIPVTEASKGVPTAFFLRRPEIAGGLVALTCLACVALFRVQ